MHLTLTFHVFLGVTSRVFFINQTQFCLSFVICIQYSIHFSENNFQIITTLVKSSREISHYGHSFICVIEGKIEVKFDMVHRYSTDKKIESKLSCKISNK